MWRDSIRDEVKYIESYCQKIGFDKYVTKEYKEFFKSLIMEYGFIKMQQAIYRVNKFNSKYKMQRLKQELEKMSVDMEELKKIPAYRDAMQSKYNEKINEEYNEMYNKLYNFGKEEYTYTDYEQRNYTEEEYAEIERKLLGWDKEEL